MERFAVENRCPQCASSAASYKPHNTACSDIGAEGEHWHRQCPSCGFEWAEATRAKSRVEVDRG
jgi:DNA-directed RNA polymerase subunit M/transcription elongation factor TFIIS